MASQSGGINFTDTNVELQADVALSAASSSINYTGSTVDVGAHDLNLNSPATFEDTAVVFGEDHGSAGQIASTSTIAFQDDVVFRLEIADDPEFWTGRTLATGAITGSVTIDSVFYDLDDSASGAIKVGDFSVAKAFSHIQPTPNVLAVSNLFALMVARGESNVGDVARAISASVTLPDPAKANIAVRQLIGESMVNTVYAVSSTAQKTQSVVFGRIDRIREVELDSKVPPAAGSADGLNRLWAGGFGVWADAKDNNNVYGFEYAGGGASLGYDREVASAPGLRLGASAIFAKGDIDNNDNLTDADLDTFGLGVYGSYTLSNGLFFDANVSYSSTETDYTTALAIGGAKSGSFDTDSWQFGLRAGALLKASSFQFTPSVGFRYTHFKQHGWNESLNAAAVANGAVANRFGARNDNQVDIPVQLKINTSIDAGSVVVTPELRLGVTFTPKRLDNALTVGFVGSNMSAEIVGVKPRSATFNGGLGLKISTQGMFDAFVNYDVDAAKGFTSHSVSAGVGFDF